MPRGGKVASRPAHVCPARFQRTTNPSRHGGFCNTWKNYQLPLVALSQSAESMVHDVSQKYEQGSFGSQSARPHTQDRSLLVFIVFFLEIFQQNPFFP